MAFKEGIINFYNENKYWDIALIANDNTKFKCHKIVLGAVSKTFEKKFLEDEDNTTELELNLNSNTLAIIVEYIYQDVINIDSAGLAMQLLKFAADYKIATLTTVVKKYINENLSIFNLVTTLEFLTVISNSIYFDFAKCKQFVCYNFREILNSKELTSFSLEFVCELTSCDNVNVPELELFNGVQKWMDNKIKNEGDADNLRMFFKELVKNIRFLTMTPAEFLSGPMKSCLLTDNDKMSLLANINVSDSMPMPQGFSTSRSTREIKITKPNFFEKFNSFVKYNQQDNIKWRTFNISQFNFTSGEEYCSPIIELRNCCFSLRIIAKLYNNNYNHSCISISVENHEDDTIIGNSILRMAKYDNSYHNIRENYFRIDPGTSKKFSELPLHQLVERGFLFDDKISFKILFEFS